ncbi:MAG: glycosyltransferase family 2 protein [Deltaproteobacteria bacterium]|nr:glycosyltransferase family 2 protein [Deltaproteobacteria bacterium]
MPLTVSVVVPARNEAPSVGAVLDGAKPHADELILIDGRSTDDTVAIAQRAGARILTDDGRGKGSAVRQGIREATGDIVVFIDADGSHDPADIPRLVAPIQEGNADLVVGSRPKGGSDELHGDLEKFARMIGSDIITLCINYRFGVRLSDSQNGFRALRTEAGRRLTLREDSTTIEQEMLMQALHHGLRCDEVPAHEYAREHGTSSIVLPRVAHRYVACLVRGLLSKRR